MLKNSWRKKTEVARRMTSLRPGPRFASLFVTRKCNLTCPYCSSILQSYKDVKTDEWRRIIDRLHGFGVRVFSLTGGEPTVRGDIFDIIRHISRERKAVSWMISNFKTMTRDRLDRLADSGLHFLTCSLDSFRGEGVKSSMAVLDLVEYAKEKGLLVSTLTVVTEKNKDEVPDILREVTRRGILFDMGLYQHVGGEFSQDDAGLKMKSMREVETLRKLLRRTKLETGLVAPSWTYLTEDLGHYDRLDWKCSSTSDSFLVVNNDGRLMTCQEYTNDVHALEIESLADPRWREAKRATVTACKGCYYGCYHQKERHGAADIALSAYTLARM